MDWRRRGNALDRLLAQMERRQPMRRCSELLALACRRRDSCLFEIKARDSIPRNTLLTHIRVHDQKIRVG